ncbi:hypothetical protein Ae201684P_021992 [Aphanomyces euteiches]|uniref:Uncharacterized protein n=1 Tax=Aphanomyces euteiches TaxID=100861 RepID=A0A6G0W7Y1_9STRA|nr:hypothetical protein Ae201684_017800 [Aphanomyces euteiches]KAH9072413.1 hypothetical protein Ae201684P_021992 [Aphanomyces euteiches]
MADPAAGVAADTTTLGDDFPSLGLSHTWLVAWKDDMLAKGRISPASTTTDVCEAVVKPETIESNCSYAQKHINGPTQGIGKATHFVSHAWKYSFCDLISAIEIFALSLPPDEAKSAFFWVDLFVVDQHHAPSRPHSWWSSTFVDAIRSFGKVVLVFQPLLDPIPLTRAWCLWEIFTAIQTGASISLAMPTEQWTNYRVSLRQDYHAVIDSLQRVDARNAEAWNPRDKEEIFHAIEVSVGFDELNRRVRQLVAGILLVGVTRHACLDNNLQRITDILALEPDINTVSTFLTPLGVASDMNSPLVVDFLLARGADINARMAWGHTPLHIACRAGHADVVRLLLLGGANQDLVNEAGRTPLEEADVMAHSQDDVAAPTNISTLAPELEEAIKTAKNAIYSLTKSDINELKSWMKPPICCAKVMKCIVLILRHPAPRNSEELTAWWEVGSANFSQTLAFTQC